MTKANIFSFFALVSSIAFLQLGCNETPYLQGQAIYEYKCGNCHMNDGSGLVGNIPPVAQADWIAEKREDLACVIRYGMQGKIEVNGLPFSGVMQGFPELSDTELLNVANYILTSWGNDQEPLKANELSSLLAKCELKKPIKVGNPQKLY